MNDHTFLTYKGWEIPFGKLELLDGFPFIKESECPFLACRCPDVNPSLIPAGTERILIRCGNCIGNSKGHLVLMEYLESKEYITNRL